jgi:CHRD domain-containing protein
VSGLRYHASAIVIAVLFAVALAAEAQTEVRYKVRLAPVPMDIAMRSTVAGRGSATAVLKGSSLTVSGTFDGLRSPATTARLHQGATMGLRGMPFADLTISKTTNGTITGSVTLTPEQARALERGRVYLQISSERAPDGNLWGWFVR